MTATAGLFPNQILDAYGIAPLHANGLEGQGIRVAILGEAPTPSSDVTAYRNCFGFQGTTLTIHGGSGITPILESSLDAMTLAMVAPKLARLDLWVKALGQNDPARGARAACRAAAGDDERHPAAQRDLDLLRHLRGERQALHRGANAVRPPAGGDVCARDHDGRRCGRQRLVVVRARGAVVQLTASTPKRVDVLAGDVTLGARRRRDEPHAHAANAIDSSACGTTRNTRRRTADGRGWRRRQQLRGPAVVAAGDLVAEDLQDGSGRRGVRRRQSRLRDHLLARGSGLRPRARADDLVRRRHERGRPSRRRHDRPLGSAGAAVRSPQARVRPAAPVLDRAPRPGSFLDIVTGDNSVFSGVSCCTAGTGFDMASGLGSPLADQIATHLHH